MRRRIFLSLFFALSCFGPALGEEDLVSGVSQDLIQITSNYTGSDIVVFGDVERQEKRRDAISWWWCAAPTRR